ncbi:MAG: bifunctional nuclease family protein [Ilumatobacter sp.]|nr:bifunctional nuclease family protein [Ilumatobacter sp.]
MLSVQLIGIEIDAATGAAVVMLQEHDVPHRVLPIVIGGADAASIAIAASGKTLPRPMTHDLMATLVESLDVHVDAVEVSDIQGGAMLATLALSGPTGERRLDTRPSDAIALAVRLHAPLFVSEHVLDAMGTVPEPASAGDPDVLDATAIDAEVGQFRDFLADIDPADFA